MASELRQLVTLAWPLALTNAGSMVMNLVDTAMVGRLGEAQLAGVSLGGSLYFLVTSFALGVVLGMDPLVSQAVGAGEEVRARGVMWQGLRVAVWLCVPCMVLPLLIPYALGPFGIDAATLAECRSFLWGRIWNVPSFLVYYALRGYLQAKDATRPLIIAMVFANVANVVGNMLLIPPLGVFGSGLASSIAFALGTLFLVAAVRAIPVAGTSHRRPDPATMRQIAVLGTPVGLQHVAEIGLFSLSLMFIAGIGARWASGHQVAITLAACTYMGAVGIAQAASVRVGYHVGRSDTPGARHAGFVAMGLGAAYMTVWAVVFIAAPRLCARLLTDKETILSAAIPLVRIAAVFQIFDGLQAVAAGALRGAGDTKMPFLGNVIGHWTVGLPVGLYLGFTQKLGAPGIWWGLCAGLVATAVILIARFQLVASRPIARV